MPITDSLLCTRPRNHDKTASCQALQNFATSNKSRPSTHNVTFARRWPSVHYHVRTYVRSPWTLEPTSSPSSHGIRSKPNYHGASIRPKGRPTADPKDRPNTVPNKVQINYQFKCSQLAGLQSRWPRIFARHPQNIHAFLHVNYSARDNRVVRIRKRRVRNEFDKWINLLPGIFQISSSWD